MSATLNRYRATWPSLARRLYASWREFLTRFSPVTKRNASGGAREFRARGKRGHAGRLQA
jgi:hypothetical protein